MGGTGDRDLLLDGHIDGRTAGPVTTHWTALWILSVPFAIGSCAVVAHVAAAIAIMDGMRPNQALEPTLRLVLSFLARRGSTPIG